MSFSWWCNDKSDKDLFEEFKINSQALGLAQDGGGEHETTPYTISDIRDGWSRIPYKDQLDNAARDAIILVRTMVEENLNHFIGPQHPECPHCKCQQKPRDFFGFDIEQAKRFLQIPIDRPWRAGGGY